MSPPLQLGHLFADLKKMKLQLGHFMKNIIEKKSRKVKEKNQLAEAVPAIGETVWRGPGLSIISGFKCGSSAGPVLNWINRAGRSETPIFLVVLNEKYLR